MRVISFAMIREFIAKHADADIVAIVIFINKKVYLRFVGTHEEYDKIKDIKNI